MEPVELKKIEPNTTRGMICLWGILSATVGAGLLWGYAASFFVGGLFFSIPLILDEYVERFTKILRHS